MRRRGCPPWVSLLLVGVGILLIFLAWPGVERSPVEDQPASAPASPTPEPIVPTRTLTEGAATAIPAVATAPPTEAAVDASPTATHDTQQATRTAYYQGQPRWGAGVASGPISRYNVGPLRLGWYVNWTAQRDSPRPGGVEYVQMIRLKGGVLQPNAESIAAIARANPGSLWLIGNEPDVIWQDNVEPAVYARLYHEAYSVIKATDPTAQVAIGGVTQPTPLRLHYLEAVLAAYREQSGAETPVDVWNVHNFILQEERGSWGVDIPPGMPDDRGMLYEIEDSGNLEIFRQQIVDFRRWMAQRGYQDRPLIVSEYGILMPEEYGFPPERVVTFLTGTFDFFLDAADPALGYQADGYRLVQRWCWYSLADTIYPTGNIFDPQTGERTAVGEGWTEYVIER